MHVKRRNLLAFIFSGACGRRRRGGPNSSFHTGDQQNECMDIGKQRLISEKTQQIQVAVARKRRRVTLSFYGFLRRRSSGFKLRKLRMIRGKGRSGNTLWMLRPRFRRIIAKKRDVDETEKAREVELCKKRILMGGKCRPLNPSGVLHYDEEGIFLPEDVLV